MKGGPSRRWCPAVVLVAVVLLAAGLVVEGRPETRTCTRRRSRCFLRRITCPKQCPTANPKDPKDKVCYIDCESPICQAQCKHRIPNCQGKGAACLDPRFIGGDGVVFYFHGHKNRHFALLSDASLQLNAHFIGLRPPRRSRDFTWIQSLGLLYHPLHNFTLSATPVAHWDPHSDHLSFTYDGAALPLPLGYPSKWTSPKGEITVERTSDVNSAVVSVDEVVEISVRVVPITEEDDRVHGYGIPEDDCFAHLEVQFRFMGLSPEVEGVLGRTYRPDFENPAKAGVAMAVVGGEDRYMTSSLLAGDCGSCVFNSGGGGGEGDGGELVNYGLLDCANGVGGGNGIVCRK